MAVMCKNGKFFNKRLMRHVQQKNNAEVLSILQNVDPRQLTNSLGNTLLHYAAKYGNNEFVQHLIDLGTAVDAQNRRRQTPLFFAVDGGHEDTALLLVEANANPFSPDTAGRCPLIRAFQYRPNIATALMSTVTVDSLKKNVEHINSEKFRLYCGLHPFILLKNVELTRFLLENGSPVNDKSPQSGDTALHLAAERLDLEHVKLLLEFNADVNAKGRYEYTPMARILITKDEEHDKALAIAKILIAAGAVLMDPVSGRPMVMDLLTTGNREIVRFLLRDQIDLRYIKKYSWLYLCALAMNKQADVLAEVPNLELFVKTRHFTGATMLHIAAMNRNVDAVIPLLDHGADVDAEEEHGETPLDRVIGGCTRFGKYDETFHKLLNFAEVLLERGARPRLIVQYHMIESYPAVAVIQDQFLPLLEPVLAYLALREASGEAIDGPSYDNIEKYPQCKSVFDSMRRQVDELKRVKIWQSLTLIDFFHASDRQLLSYARIQSLILGLTEAMKGCHSDLYLHRKLRQRFVRFTQLIRTRTKFITIINDCFMKFHRISVNTIAEEIADYLKCQELYKMSSTFE